MLFYATAILPWPDHLIASHQVQRLLRLLSIDLPTFKENILWNTAMDSINRA